MSEEASDVTAGSAPGKRPLDRTSDINADSDDSSITPKRIKVLEEIGKVDSPKINNAISNGGVDSPTSNGENKLELEDISNQREQILSLPKYVTEADSQSSIQPEANGKEDDSSLSSKTNSKTTSDMTAPYNSNKKSDEERQESEQVHADPHCGQNDQKEESNNVVVNDVNTDTCRTDNSGSRNGENSKPSNSVCESASSSEEKKVPGDKENGTESDDEAMEVDIENNTDNLVGTRLLDKLETKSEANLDSVCTPKPNETDTSVPNNSSGARSQTDNSTGEQLVTEAMDSQNSAKDIDCKMEVTPGSEKTSKGKEDEVLTEKAPDSTGNAMEIGEDNKENKEEIVDCLHLLSEEQHEARYIIMKRLQEELRNEETKLLLLKKLRLNQQQPVSVPTKTDGSGAASATAATNANGTGPTHGHRTGLPPNMAHSSMSGKPHASIQPQANSSHRPDMPQMMRGTHIQRQLHNYNKGHTGPPPLIMAQTSRSSSSSTSQSGQMVRAPVVRISTSSTAPTTSTHSVSRQMQQQQSSSSSSSSNSRQNQMANDGQSAASRQAAAKLALRKQLEKTLLQIPPPKPPPPELHFLPSAANNEFIILVGLEEVVNTILDLDKKDKNQSKGFLQPYKCAQCNTDFTTIWKQDPKQGIMCESCIVSNQKKALKAEHTNRLKTAFVKALQQEQEIEQRIQQSQSTTQQSSTSRVSSSTQRHRTQNSVHRSQTSSIHHSSSSSSSSSQAHRQRVMNPAPSQRVVQQPIHYAYIPPPNYPATAAPQIQIVPKQHMMTSHRTSAADRQREYLLDMIPSKGLGHPQSSVIWKR